MTNICINLTDLLLQGLFASWFRHCHTTTTCVAAFQCQTRFSYFMWSHLYKYNTIQWLERHP